MKQNSNENWARLVFLGAALIAATLSILHVAPATAALKRVIIVDRLGDVGSPSLIDTYIYTYQEDRLKLAALHDVPTRGMSDQSGDFGE